MASTDRAVAPGELAAGAPVASSETLPRPPGSSRLFFVGLALIMVVGLAVRVGFVLIRQSKVHLTTGDAYWYHFQARLVADGRGFLNPFEFYKNGRSVAGADHPPGLVLILALADKLGLASAQAQRLLMCVLGTGTVGVIGVVGRRIANPRVGLVAAFLAATYPNMWINDGMLMAETPFVFAVALSLWFTYRIFDRPSTSAILGLSAWLMVAAMTRPESIVLFPLYLVPLVLARREVPLRERIAKIAVAALVPLIAFAPWVVYNMGRFEKPVLVSTGAGQTLAVGNCDLTYAGDFLGFYNVNCLLPPQIVPPTGTDASVRDPKFQKIALDYIGDHKGAVPKVVAARVGRMWHLYRVKQSKVLDGVIEGRSGGPPGSGRQPVQWALYGYYLLMPLALAGVVLLRRRRVKVYPLLTHAALATFVAATTFGVTRYRAGAEVAVVLLAAVAVDRLIQRWSPATTRSNVVIPDHARLPSRQAAPSDHPNPPLSATSGIRDST